MIPFDKLSALCGKRAVVDAPCPLCGPSCKSGINQKRKVLRIWDCGNGFITFKCARCEAHGFSRDGHDGSVCDHVPQRDPEPDKRDFAARLWSMSLPYVGSLAEVYLKFRCCGFDSPNVRFLPARDGYPPAMIARFGSEWRPTGVHLTKLAVDGKGKAGTDKDKIMIGPSQGQPIIVNENDDSSDLVITEGIEDAATIARQTGWESWAAGSAGRIAKLIPLARRYERVFVTVDNDPPRRVELLDGTVQFFPGASTQAWALCKAIRSDVIPLNFAKVLNSKVRLDANLAAITYGSAAVMAVIRWSEAQAEFCRGLISFEAMRSALDAAISPFVEPMI